MLSTRTPGARDSLEEATQPGGVGAVQRDHQVEPVPAGLPLLEVRRARQEVEGIRHGVRAREGGGPPDRPEREAEPELRAEHVPVRVDVREQERALTLANGLHDLAGHLGRAHRFTAR